MCELTSQQIAVKCANCLWIVWKRCNWYYPIFLVFLVADNSYLYAGYQQAGSNKRWQLVQELREAQAAVTLLDQHLDRQLASLPKKIIDAVNSIMQARQDSNHEFAYIASGIALGRIIRNAGLLINTATITTATALNVIGLSISAGAFGASRAVNVRLWFFIAHYMQDRRPWKQSVHYDLNCILGSLFMYS